MFTKILKEHASGFDALPAGGSEIDSGNSSSDEADELEPCPFFLEALKKQEHMEDVLNNISHGHSR